VLLYYWVRFCKENAGDFENERTKVSTAYNSTFIIWYCSTKMPGIAFTYWSIFGDLIKKG